VPNSAASSPISTLIRRNERRLRGAAQGSDTSTVASSPSESSLPVLNAEFRAAVLDACDRDWKTISPAIFGSMFQSVRDAETRRQLGEHYTSEENILKTLNPLFLDELRAEYDASSRSSMKPTTSANCARSSDASVTWTQPAAAATSSSSPTENCVTSSLAIMERLQEITGDNRMLLANVGLR
jgi:hypothetical protein